MKSGECMGIFIQNYYPGCKTDSFRCVVGVRLQAITEVKQLHAGSVLISNEPVRGLHIETLSGRPFCRYCRNAG